MLKECDVAIVGCGPAGLSAGIYCSRAGLKTVILGIPEKSQAELAKHIENYFGFPEGIDGAILVNKGIIHCKKFGAEFVKEEAVTAVRVDQGGKASFVIKTSGGNDVRAKSMIIATGVPIRLSGIKNEEQLTGRGVHYCVSCDGYFYRDKKVAIIGNGDHAAEDAVEAMSYTKDVTIIANAKDFKFSDNFDKEITKWNIRTILGKVKEFKGEKKFESLVMEDGTEMRFDGVFMACGTAGALDFAANLGLEIKDNILVVDENNATSMEGVFAAGNCSGRCRQIAKNVGDGCNAGTNVIKYLRERDVYVDYGEKKIAPEEAKAGPVPQPVLTTTAAPIVMQQLPQKKLKLGWVCFSCCEDSTIVFTEILNDYWDKLKDIVEIKYARVLRNKNDYTDLDIMFVEGAISNPRAEEELKKIRENCKKLIAVGACACTGMPSGQRNTFDERRKREIEPIVRAFDYSKDVKPVHDVVKVDDTVPGCPMLESSFLNVLKKSFAEFGINAQL